MRASGTQMTRPSSLNAKYSLFFRLALSRRRNSVDGVTMPALIDTATRIKSS